MVIRQIGSRTKPHVTQRLIQVNNYKLNEMEMDIKGTSIQP